MMRHRRISLYQVISASFDNNPLLATTNRALQRRQAAAWRVVKLSELVWLNFLQLYQFQDQPFSPTVSPKLT